MPPIPLVRPREVIRAFEKLGWKVVRQKGSHIMLSKSGHMVTLSVPDHSLVPRDFAGADRSRWSHCRGILTGAG